MDSKPHDRTGAIAANRRAWDAPAPLHLQSDQWRLQCAGFVAPGHSTFDPTLTALLEREQLTGKSVVQIGCNNGREVLSLAAFGAERCVGIDQSEAFLTQAAQLQAIAGTDATFICADIHALPKGMRRNFDAALITIGVLNWMPDLARFLAIVAGLLRPGGRLIIYETHPFLEMFEPGSDAPHEPAVSYFRTMSLIDTDSLVYDGSGTGEAPQTYWFIHRLGDIMTGLVAADLRLQHFEEHPHSNREVEYDIYEGRAAQLPMCYTLVAEKP